MTSRDRPPDRRAPFVWILVVLLGGAMTIGTGCALAGQTVSGIHHQVASDPNSAPGGSFDRASMARSFRTIDVGGVEQVVAQDPANQAQLDQIRAYLQEETARFQQGHYEDPAKTHGMEMPGSKELEAGYGRIQVSYSDLPDGG